MLVWLYRAPRELMGAYGAAVGLLAVMRRMRTIGGGASCEPSRESASDASQMIEMLADLAVNTVEAIIDIEEDYGAAATQVYEFKGVAAASMHALTQELASSVLDRIMADAGLGPVIAEEDGRKVTPEISVLCYMRSENGPLGPANKDMLKHLCAASDLLPDEEETKVLLVQLQQELFRVWKRKYPSGEEYERLNDAKVPEIQRLEKELISPFLPDPVQKLILEALDGKALKKEGLAEACAVDPSRLYKSGRLEELKRLGMVHHRKGVGYYRPDAPPPEAVDLADSKEAS